MKKWILMMLCVSIIGWAMAEEATPQPARYAPGEEVAVTLYISAPEIAGLQMHECERSVDCLADGRQTSGLHHLVDKLVDV